MSKLGEQIGAMKAAAAAVQPPPTRLGEAIAGTGAMVHRDTIIPVGDGVPCKMRVLGHDEQMQATARMGVALHEAGLASDGVVANWMTTDTLEQERARQFLAIACRDPEDVGKPVGSLEDWRSPAITGPVLIRLWVEYADLVATFDPCNYELTAEDLRDLVTAIEKKSPRALVAFGSAMLASFLLSTAVQLAPSPTQTSSPESSGTEKP